MVNLVPLHCWRYLCHYLSFPGRCASIQNVFGVGKLTSIHSECCCWTCCVVLTTKKSWLHGTHAAALISRNTGRWESNFPKEERGFPRFITGQNLRAELNQQSCISSKLNYESKQNFTRFEMKFLAKERFSLQIKLLYLQWNRWYECWLFMVKKLLKINNKHNTKAITHTTPNFFFGKILISETPVNPCLFILVGSLNVLNHYFLQWRLISLFFRLLFKQIPLA